MFPDYTGTNSSGSTFVSEKKRTKAKVQLAPDVSSLWKVYREVKAFKTPEEELERASKLDLSTQLFGVSKKFQVTVSSVPLVFQTA